MIRPRHDQLLAQALGDLLGQPAKGTLAFLRCLPSASIEALAGSSDFVVAGFHIFGVTDRQDASCRLITADRAVELREIKTNRSYFSSIPTVPVQASTGSSMLVAKSESPSYSTRQSVWRARNYHGATPAFRERLSLWHGVSDSAV
jgi:hypothetical protein